MFSAEILVASFILPIKRIDGARRALQSYVLPSLPSLPSLSELLGEVGAEPAVIRAAVGTDGTVHEGEAVAVEDVVDWQADGQEWQSSVEPCAADAVVFP